MKKIEKYLKGFYQLKITEDPYEGGFVVSFPELPGCITCVDSVKDILWMAEDAKRVWLEAAIEDGVNIPEPHTERNPCEIFSLADILRPIFKQYNVKSAILFGSVAKGSANEYSDIDLLVDSRLEGFKFCGLANKIEEAVNKPVDLFDVKTCLMSPMLKKVLFWMRK